LIVGVRPVTAVVAAPAKTGAFFAVYERDACERLVARRVTLIPKFPTLALSVAVAVATVASPVSASRPVPRSRLVKASAAAVSVATAVFNCLSASTRFV